MNQKICPVCGSSVDGVICSHCGHDLSAKNASHQLAVGTVLNGDYVIGRVLGQGGFGITYLGWNRTMDIPVAIKEYYPRGLVTREGTVSTNVFSYDGNSEQLFEKNKSRFLKEARALWRCEAVPEIVRVNGFFEANNTAYIIMEYVRGTELNEYVAAHGGRLSEAETLNVFRPVITAMAKVHATGLIHRDISPDNIMLLPDGRTKILDFGAVKDTGSGSVSTETMVKHGYAPIEQYSANGEMGTWTDVYAVCASMYYCLTGETPPAATSRIFEDASLSLREKAPTLSGGTEAAILHGMAIKKAGRTATMDELYAQLYENAPVPPEGDAFIPPSPPPTPPTQPAPPKDKPNRSVLLGVAAAAVVLLGIVLFRPDSKPEKTVSSPTAVQTAAPVVKEPETTETPAPPAPTPQPEIASGIRAEYYDDGRIKATYEIDENGEQIKWYYEYNAKNEFKYKKRLIEKVDLKWSTSGMNGTDMYYQIPVEELKDCVGFTYDFEITVVTQGTGRGDRRLMVLNEEDEWEQVELFSYPDYRKVSVEVELDRPREINGIGTFRIGAGYAQYDAVCSVRNAWVCSYDY